MIQKSVRCPNCSNIVTCSGKPGDVVLVSCPLCYSKGKVTFKESDLEYISDLEKSKRRKKHYKDIKKEKIYNKKKVLNKIFTIKKVISIVIAIVFSLLIFLFIVLPTIQGSMHFLIVQSGSMKPAMQPGDLVVVTSTESKNIKIGDIISFTYEDEPDNCITHRVVSINNETTGFSFQTKGDANEEPDIRPVNSSNLVGKTLLVIPYLGYLPDFVKSPFGFIILIVIPSVLIISGELLNILKIKNNESKKKARP